MSIITLTTDFGNKDYAVGAVKAALISAISPLQIVDISHEISPYNLTECAYILKNAPSFSQRKHSYYWSRK